MEKKFSKGRSEGLSTDEKYINLVIKEQFYLNKVDTIKLSVSVIYHLIQQLHYRVNVLDIIEYLNKRWKLTCEAIEFAYRRSYFQDARIYDKDRCYIFHDEEFMTVEELYDFHQMMKNDSED